MIWAGHQMMPQHRNETNLTYSGKTRGNSTKTVAE